MLHVRLVFRRDVTGLRDLLRQLKPSLEGSSTLGFVIILDGAGLVLYRRHGINLYCSRILFYETPFNQQIEPCER